MAVLRDPTGAVFALWQPGDNIGATVVNGPGVLSLNQLNTSDPDRAGDFYRRVFGWRIESVGTPEWPYWGIWNGDALNGGMMSLPPDAAAPSHWLVYFGSDDVEEDSGRIAELGGRVLVPPTSVPGGRIIVAADPQGAAVALFDGRFDE
jgi:predicted enzyme related to lactoylglutathione lyase